MKFKIGDKVKATDEYLIEHEKAMEFIWGKTFDKSYNSKYSNMVVTNIMTYMNLECVFTDHSAIPWLERDLEFIER